jgi:probable rRNA maturation factor
MAVDVDLDLQVATEEADLPSQTSFEQWVAATLNGRREQAVLTIRVVDPGEGAALNLQYRGLDRPTNVLSFPFELPAGLMPDADDPIAHLLGDLIICADVVRREALEQGKDARSHWAHMVVHGVLHLIDYDHITEEDAEEMETLETNILGELGFPPPYEHQDILEDQ